MALGNRHQPGQAEYSAGIDSTEETQDRRQKDEAFPKCARVSRNMSKRGVAVFVLILAAVVSVSAANTTYYVDSVGGDDGNSGTSISRP